jgi:type IV secretion system protein VirD4
VTEESKAVAADIITEDPLEHDKHWPRAAKTNQAAMNAFVAEVGGEKDRSLNTAIEMGMNRELREKALRWMQTSGRQGGLLARMADEASHAQGDELASVLTTQSDHVSCFNTPAVAESLSSSTFDPRVLKAEKAVAFYVVPPTHLKTERGLLRHCLGGTIRALMKDGLGGRVVHGVIDEAAAIGQMDAIDQALSVGRGYSLRIQLYFQSMAQMEVCYPHGQHLTVLAQCAQVYFGVKDVATATHVEKTLGPRTVVVESGGTNEQWSRQKPHIETTQHSGSTSRSWTTNDNWNQQQRPLMFANEVMMLPRRTAITVTPGCPPIMTTLVPYYEDSTPCKPQGNAAPKALTAALVAVALAGVAARGAVKVSLRSHSPNRKVAVMSAREMIEGLENRSRWGRWKPPPRASKSEWRRL